MKQTIVVYIADKAENEILQCFEQDKTKVVCSISTITFNYSKEVTEDYIRDGIRRAKEEYLSGKGDSWIAAVSYMGNLFKENESSIIFVCDNVGSYEVVID